jgi:hypothetical protein
MRFMRIAFGVVILAAAGVSAFLYSSSRRADHRDDTLLASNTADIGASSATIGHFTAVDPPRPAPELSITTRDGSPGG